MSKPSEACCSSPAVMFYWFAASIVAWGLLSLMGLYCSLLGPSSASTTLVAAGIGCIANWLKNRTFHCGITAPLFLIGGIEFVLSDAQIVHIEPRFVWAFVLLGAGIAFLLEWKYARRSKTKKSI